MDWFLIFLKHAPSCGDPVSSCIINMPFHVAIPASHIFNTPPRVALPFIITYLRQAPHVVISVHHTPETCPPSPELDETASSYILNAPPSSPIFNTHAPPSFANLFANLLNPPPTFHRPAAAAGLKKRAGGFGGAQTPPPPICNHNVRIRGSERIHMRAVFSWQGVMLKLARRLKQGLNSWLGG